MASSQSPDHPQPEIDASLQPNSLSFPRPITSTTRRDQDLPLQPPQSPSSESDGMSHNHMSGLTRSSVPTQPTAITSIPAAEKSEPSSLLYEQPLPTGGTFLSASGRDQLGGDVSRYPSISRPRPVLSLDGNAAHGRTQSGLEWIVPTSEKRRERTVAERLDPTLTTARIERDKCARRARYNNWALNIAIGLQVVIGALTTGVAAATTGRSTSIGVSVLGGLSTILASYLAKTRGSNEPEFSTLRARELDTFVRELEAFMMDKGHMFGAEYDVQINKFRTRYEDIIRTQGEDDGSGIAHGQNDHSKALHTLQALEQVQQIVHDQKAMEKV